MKKRIWIKIWIVLVVTWVVCFSDFWFAEDGASEVKRWSIARMLNFIISILSWIWVVFAKLAWEFLTNKRVYWEIIWLDKLLWKYWVIVRNIANFWLWFYFIYIIFSAFVWKDDIIKRVKDVLIWLLVGWVWIQASWFVTSAIVDVSTITLVAAWSLPAYVISKNPQLQEGMHRSLKDFADSSFNVNSGVMITLFPNNWNSNTVLETQSVPIEWLITKEQLIDMLLPDADGEFGPLYYIWFAILNVNKVPPVDLSSLDWAKKTILNVIIVSGTTIVYSIEMLVLCVLALMRILYLRMFIVLSPLAVLFLCVGKSSKKALGKNWWFLESITKQVNFWSFFINVFKPTIIVLWMWIALMFSVLMSDLVNESGNSVDTDLWWVHIRSQKTGDDTYDTVVSSEYFSYALRNTAKGLLETIISILVVILVYFIIKIAVWMWKWTDFVSDRINKLQGSVEDAITSIPIVPVKGYDENGVENENAALSRNDFKSASSRKLSNMTYAATQLTNKQTEYAMKWLWFIDDNSLTDTDKAKISHIMDTSINKWEGLKNQRDYISKIKNKGWKWMVLNPNAPDPFWRKEFTDWLNGTDPKTVGDQRWGFMLIEWQKESDKNKRDLRTLFDKPNHANTYANFFGYTTWNYNNFDSIMDLDISRK